MRRLPDINQVGPSTEPWEHLRWEVIMYVNSRQVVETVACFARITPERRGNRPGYASLEVGPFEDLQVAVSAAMLEAALDLRRPTPDPDQMTFPEMGEGERG